ncbi:MAG: bifunctional methionine sulfoxide reductase B/A protein [Phycisphaerales bacterium]|nr:bifunctional methionine sulfoxide reductase B/A protein [Phycisphaerales bacterium]
MLSPRTFRNIALAIFGLSIPLAFYAIMIAATNANASPRDSYTMSKTSTQSNYSQSGHNIARLSDEKIQELAKDLSPEDRRIILNDGTEPPFCGNLLDNKKEGVYHCKLCKLPLFGSDSKFTSGTGWPSFFTPVDPAHVSTEVDTSHGMVREEITCTRCNAHLGHVFPDGPEPTGLRFCVNSASLEFFEEGDTLPMAALPTQTQTAYFAGGCFWGIEDRYAKLPGVLNVVSGYQGGDDSKTPTYQEVCTGATGHAESVRVDFDPSVVSYAELLAWFFRIHDPTQGNRQGPDVGTQYRSAIYTTSDEQYTEAKAFIEAQQKEGRWSKRTITTELRRAEDTKFYEAEEYHQDYYAKNGGTCAAPIYPED